MRSTGIFVAGAMGALMLASAGAASAASSDYTLTSSGDIGAGAYSTEATPITQRPDNAWGDYSAPVGAPPLFEVINGATTAGERFWYSDESVTSGVTYDVTAVLANNYSVSAPTIQLTVGGSPAGAVQTLNFTTKVTDGTPGPWQTLQFSYTATASGTPTFGLVDTNLDFNGNDFSLSTVSVAAVSAAPEPAAWALLMLAVGMIGTSLRLRRRRGAVAAA